MSLYLPSVYLPVDPSPSVWSSIVPSQPRLSRYIQIKFGSNSPKVMHNICDPICKNPEQSRILENSDFCTMVFCMPKGFFCSSIKSVIQIVLELQG